MTLPAGPTATTASNDRVLSGMLPLSHFRGWLPAATTIGGRSLR